MKDCPHCQSEMGVKDSRPMPYGIRRRRVCPSCGFAMSTVEIPAEQYQKIGGPAKAASELRAAAAVMLAVADGLATLPVVKSKRRA